MELYAQLKMKIKHSEIRFFHVNQQTKYLVTLSLLCYKMTKNMSFSYFFLAIFIAGCTGRCRNDTFRCCQQWKLYLNDDISITAYATCAQNIIIITYTNYLKRESQHFPYCMGNKPFKICFTLTQYREIGYAWWVSPSTLWFPNITTKTTS